jgi:plasmid stabilization system protein ParE
VQVDLHPEAAEEAAAAVEWYRERSEAAAAAFTVELERAIELIAAEPD